MKEVLSDLKNRIKKNTMECSKCQTKNIINVNYCKHCGNKFSESEKKASYNKTLLGKMDYVLDTYKFITLQKFLTNKIVRIIILVTILLIGVLSYITNDRNVSILKSDNYETYKNEQKHEYYILVEDGIEEIPVNVYVPNFVYDLKIYRYNKDNKRIETIIYDSKKDLILKTDSDDYYIFESNFITTKKDSLKVSFQNKDLVKID